MKLKIWSNKHMSGIHHAKALAAKIRQHRLALSVMRVVRAAGHSGIQKTGYTDMIGARLVEHDFIVHGVHVLVRPNGYQLKKAELTFIRTHNAYVQLGSYSVSKLLVHLDTARASANIMNVQHWSTVGNSD